jgi:uncharacterized ion transporter superfamily protein YfcC
MAYAPGANHGECEGSARRGWGPFRAEPELGEDTEGTGVNRFPDTLPLVGAILVGFMVLTWVVPGGRYERVEVEGRTVVDPNAFSVVPRNPVMPWELLMVPLKGFQEAADVIGFVFLIGASFSVVTRTGAIQAGLMGVVRWGEQHPRYRAWTIPAMMTLFSLGGATFGMAEETLVFILITIPMARAMGYDVLVGVSIPVVGAFSGFAGAFMNPFTVGIAQGIAELPLFSGLGYRLLVWAVFTGVSIGFVMHYAARVAADPNRSGMAGHAPVGEIGVGAEVKCETLTARRLGVLGVLGLTLVGLVVGATAWGWYIPEISGLFLAMGLLAAVVYRLQVGETVAAFYQGARDMTVAAVLIGFARSLLVVAEEGRIIDTLLHAVAAGSEGQSRVVSVELMLAAQTLLNLFVPSGSGQAALTMPIMTPLSDLLGITRQTAVLAYQFGDGVTNLIIPTSGLLMAILGVARVPYDRWVRFIWPLVLMLFLAAMLLLLPPVTFMDWR